MDEKSKRKKLECLVRVQIREREREREGGRKAQLSNVSPSTDTLCFLAFSHSIVKGIESP
jgi:hypothetical protein